MIKLITVRKNGVDYALSALKTEDRHRDRGRGVDRANAGRTQRP